MKPACRQVLPYGSQKALHRRRTAWVLDTSSQISLDLAYTTRPTTAPPPSRPIAPDTFSKPHLDERPPLPTSRECMNWSFFSHNSSSIACCPIFFSRAAIRTWTKVLPFSPAIPAAMDPHAIGSRTPPLLHARGLQHRLILPEEDATPLLPSSMRFTVPVSLLHCSLQYYH